MNSMTEHLTAAQLEAYRSKILSPAERREMSRHLLQCKKCLAALPPPTIEQFLTAIFEENAINQADETTKQSTKNSIFTDFFNKPSLFAWSGGVMAAVLLSLTFLVWMASTRSYSTENETAKFSETEAYKFNQNQTHDKSGNLQTQPAVDSNGISLVKNLKDNENRVPKLASSNRERSKSKKYVQPALSTKIENKLLTTAKTNVVLTRGDSKDCASENLIEVETAAAESGVVLKWKKIPNAAKYNLYISDDNEILIDEFESGRETSYVLTKTLDPAKAYQWKVVVTLENGKTIVGRAQKFKVNDFQVGSKKFEKKEKAETRCSPEKN